MTTDRELKVSQLMWSVSLDTAKQLGLIRRDDIDNLLDGQFIMVATPYSMNIGTVILKYSETETSRTESYYLNGVLLYEHQYDSAVPSWGEHPKLVNHLPKKVVLYVSY